MLSTNRILVVLLTIICFSLAYTSQVNAKDKNWAEILQEQLADHPKDPLLQQPWPKGEKVPCRCDILAMPYELCLKGIGREECFKVKEVKQPVTPEKKECLKGWPPIEPSIHWQDKMSEYSSTSSCYKVSKVSSEEENVIPIPIPETKPEAPQMPPYNGQPLIYNEALPCHPVDIWLEKMQNEFQLYPFAQGKATVRSADNFEFTYPEMIMLANPLLKRFMMIGVWPNDYACVLASGTEFESFNK